MDFPQSQAAFDHLISEFTRVDVRKDFETITMEHNAMLKIKDYSDLVVEVTFWNFFSKDSNNRWMYALHSSSNSNILALVQSHGMFGLMASIGASSPPLAVLRVRVRSRRPCRISQTSYTLSSTANEGVTVDTTRRSQQSTVTSRMLSTTSRTQRSNPTWMAMPNLTTNVQEESRKQWTRERLGQQTRRQSPAR